MLLIFYQQEASKFIQATFVSFIQSILEEEFFTQLQGSGKTVSSLQVRSRVDNKLTCTRVVTNLFYMRKTA